MPFVAQPTEKCEGCGKTVYATEKTVVEEKAAKKVYHKTCIRCSTCNKVLGLGEFSSLDGVFYCKPHWKQLFATKGNYDEAFGKEKVSANWNPQVITKPQSFVPDTEGKSENAKDKKETSEATLAKIKKFQADGDTSCFICEKTVYAAEKLNLEDKQGKRLLHKGCFKCATCSLQLKLDNYGFCDMKYYCKNHLKEAQKVSAPSTTTVVSSTTGSFVPAPTKEETPQKGQTPDHIAAKFKGFSENADRCTACNKLVYLNEKLIIGQLTNQVLYHKSCFRCSHCNIQCEVSNYGSLNGVIYCKVHLKTVGRVEATNNVFISPLASAPKDYVPTGVQIDNDPNATVQQRDDDEPVETTSSSHETQQVAESEPVSHKEPELEQQVENLSVEESKPSESSSASVDDEESRRLERQRKLEERKKQQEAEERQQEEERQRRREERDRLRGDYGSMNSSNENNGGSSSPKGDRETERAKRREERERKEKEEEAERQKRREERQQKRLSEISS